MSRIPNASVVSAGPPSHPPALAHYGHASMDNSSGNMVTDTTVASSGVYNVKSSEGF